MKLLNFFLGKTQWRLIVRFCLVEIMSEMREVRQKIAIVATSAEK